MYPLRGIVSGVRKPRLGLAALRPSRGCGYVDPSGHFGGLMPPQRHCTALEFLASL